jgi:hypothetical protein
MGEECPEENTGQKIFLSAFLAFAGGVHTGLVLFLA